MPEGVGETTDRPRDGCRERGRSGRRVTDSTVHDSSIDPARATSSRPRPSPARLFIVFETTEYTESSPFSPRARARRTRHTTGRDSPSSPLGASIARARMEGSTVRDDARASVPGARRARARGARRARGFFCSFAVRSPIGRRSDGTAARGRSSGTAREDARTAVTEIVGGPRPSVEVRRDAVGDSRASALVT